jgi:hypothetical protein
MRNEIEKNISSLIDEILDCEFCFFDSGYWEPNPKHPLHIPEREIIPFTKYNFFISHTMGITHPVVFYNYFNSCSGWAYTSDGKMYYFNLKIDAEYRPVYNIV